MKRVPPRRFLAALYGLILLSALTAPGYGQQRPAPNDSSTAGDSPLPGVISLGSSVLSSAGRLFQEDPYEEFRDAHYSNSGLLSEQDELRLGSQLHSEVIKKYQLVNMGQERANRIGQRVARASLRPNLAYHFYVIRDKEINAFSGPGGYVYITTALMNLANDEELAAVLSHEVGHVVARHSLKSIQQSQSMDSVAGLLGSIAGIAGDQASQLGNMAAKIVGSGLLAVHSREEEREADFLGVRALPKAGVDASAMLTMFQKLQRLSKSNADLLGSLFSDHPDVQERIDNTRYEINRMRGTARTK